MARKDFIHDAIVASLEKAGWIITHDPLRLVFEEKPLAIDLGAELVSAERDNQKIAVEARIARQVLSYEQDNQEFYQQLEPNRFSCSTRAVHQLPNCTG